MREESVLGRRSTAIALFCLCLVLYFAHFGPRAQLDYFPAPHAAWSLVRHGDFDLSGYPELERFVPGTIHELPGGRLLSRLPPGSAISALPFVAPFAAHSPLPLGLGNMRRLGKLVGAAHVAAAVVLFYFLCGVLAPGGARVATLVFAFGSCVFSVASQALWPHGLALFWLTLALYLLVTRAEGGGSARFMWVGFALGMALATRTATGVFGLSTLAALGCEGVGRPLWRLGWAPPFRAPLWLRTTFTTSASRSRLGPAAWLPCGRLPSTSDSPVC